MNFYVSVNLKNLPDSTSLGTLNDSKIKKSTRNTYIKHSTEHGSGNLFRFSLVCPEVGSS